MDKPYSQDYDQRVLLAFGAAGSGCYRERLAPYHVLGSQLGTVER